MIIKTNETAANNQKYLAFHKSVLLKSIWVRSLLCGRTCNPTFSSGADGTGSNRCSPSSRLSEGVDAIVRPRAKRSQDAVSDHGGRFDALQEPDRTIDRRRKTDAR